jgi:glycosyltransferase involved in cell wall biosynthesis
MKTKETIPQSEIQIPQPDSSFCGNDISKPTICNQISEVRGQKSEVENQSNPKSEIRNPKSGNPTLSLCMIIKDEEHNLPRCLDSVADAIDEIIIVDTGSTDRTVEIAESYGAKVFHHPWEGNFSKARNYSLKYATCDWILIMDADEELQASDAPKLKEVIKDNNNSSVSFVIKNKYKNSTQEGYAKMVRLFKNFHGVHYEGIVHNIIIHSGKCFESQLSIIHHGYNLSEDKMEEKFVRTSTLLKKQIEEDPKNPVPYKYLGIAYMDRKMYDEAIANSKRALNLAEEKNINLKNLLVSYYVISATCYEKGELDEAKAYALKAVELDNQFLDGYCILSFVYYNQKEYEKLMQASGNYLNLWNNIINQSSVNEETLLNAQRGGFKNSVIYHTIGHKWKIHLLRGFYYLSNNHDAKGNFEIDLAMNESTDFKDCFTLLGNFYMENNNIDKAEDAYKKLLSINEKSVGAGFKPAPALFKLGQINLQKNNLTETLSFWKKAVETEPDAFDIRLLICAINVTQGNLEDVVTDCDQLLQILKMPRNITIDSLSDLANLFHLISENLKERDDAQSAEIASKICKELKQISQNIPISNFD